MSALLARKALKNAVRYGQWLHGEVVAARTVMAVDMSFRLGWIDESLVKRVHKILLQEKLPTTTPKIVTIDMFMSVMAVDKKLADGHSLVHHMFHHLRLECRPYINSPGVYLFIILLICWIASIDFFLNDPFSCCAYEEICRNVIFDTIGLHRKLLKMYY